MLQIRIHGRGGQGVVTAAELLSIAAFAQGRHAQAFPSFGSERTGAPVVAFCRIAGREIRLLHQVDVFQGLQPDGYVLINSQRDFHALGLADIAQQNARWCSVPATEIAIRHLGRPLPNAVMLGGFAALSSLITLAAVAHAIRHKFSAKVAEANVAAATEAFEFVRQQTQATAYAQTD